eukprot:m.70489 g.70489  ORF g.70489 m.70489 type:complete len:619 (-) comp14166_c1_seq1:96-1952(-)
MAEEDAAHLETEDEDDEYIAPASRPTNRAKQRARRPESTTNRAKAKRPSNANKRDDAGTTGSSHSRAHTHRRSNTGDPRRKQAKHQTNATPKSNNIAFESRLRLALTDKMDLWQHPQVLASTPLEGATLTDARTLMQRCLSKLSASIQDGKAIHRDFQSEFRTIALLLRMPRSRLILDASKEIARHVEGLIRRLRATLHPQEVSGVLYEAWHCLATLISQHLKYSRKLVISDSLRLFDDMRHMLIATLLVRERLGLREEIVHIMLLLAHVDGVCRQEVFEMMATIPELDRKDPAIRLRTYFRKVAESAQWGCSQCLRDASALYDTSRATSGRVFLPHDSQKCTISEGQVRQKAQVDSERARHWHSKRLEGPSSSTDVQTIEPVATRSSSAELQQFSPPAGSSRSDEAPRPASQPSSDRPPSSNAGLPTIQPAPKDLPLLPDERAKQPTIKRAKGFTTRRGPSAPPRRDRPTFGFHNRSAPVTVGVQTESTPAGIDPSQAKVPEPELYTRQVWQQASRTIGRLQYLEPPPFPEDGLEPKDAYELGRALFKQSAYLHNVSSLLLLACERHEESAITLDVVSGGLPLLACQALHAGLKAGADMMQQVVAKMEQEADETSDD